MTTTPTPFGLAGILTYIEGRDQLGDYDSRNPAVLAAMSAAAQLGYPAGIRIDPTEPEWPVVYIELPTGQVSWHLPQHTAPWDEHTTDEKYRRLREFVESVLSAPLPQPSAPERPAPQGTDTTTSQTEAGGDCTCPLGPEDEHFPDCPMWQGPPVSRRDGTDTAPPTDDDLATAYEDPHRWHEHDDVHGHPHPRVCLTCSTDDNEVEYYRRDSVVATDLPREHVAGLRAVAELVDARWRSDLMLDDHQTGRDLVPVPVGECQPDCDCGGHETTTCGCHIAGDEARAEIRRLEAELDRVDRPDHPLRAMEARANRADLQLLQALTLAAELLSESLWSAHGHPGYAARRTGWVQEATLAGWRDRLAELRAAALDTPEPHSPAEGGVPVPDGADLVSAYGRGCEHHDGLEQVWLDGWHADDARHRAELDAARAEVVRLEDEGADRMAARFAEEIRLKALEIRDGGVSLDLEPSRDMVAMWVGAARGMLGDAPNYTETIAESVPTDADPKAVMEVKLAGELERFAFTLQRVGRLSPHQARQRAEAERDQALALAEELLASLKADLPQWGTWRARLAELRTAAGEVRTDG